MQTCNDDQQNMSEVTNDCFDHAERCNRDAQCSEDLFNYTSKCAMVFSGEQMTPDQEIICKEAAKKLISFGENFTNCECNAYLELCKELFKNRFLLDRVCVKCTKQLSQHNLAKKLVEVVRIVLALSIHIPYITVMQRSCSQV